MPNPFNIHDPWNVPPNEFLNPIHRVEPIGIRGAWFEGGAAKNIAENISYKRGEDLFQLILSGIREIYEVDAVIAGGAVRDFAAGGISNTPKDVDVFIPLTWKTFIDDAEQLGWQGFPNKVNKGPYKKNNGLANATDRAVARVQYMDIDLVFLDKPLDKEDVAKFPVHAQRCVWTLEGGMMISPEAKVDLEAKIFTIDPTITDKEKIKTLLAKTREWCKRDFYKGWKIVEPDVKEWWEAKTEQKKVDDAMKKQLNTYCTYDTASALRMWEGGML